MMTIEDRLAKLERYFSTLVYILDYRNVVAPDGSDLVVALERIADDPASSYPNLINVPKPVEVWVNIYRNENGFTFGDALPSREQADRDAMSGRCGRRRIVIDTPEGFDE